MEDKVLIHRKVWKNKKILRDLYFHWYRWIEKDLSGIDGKIIEIGSGIGNYKEFKPEIISADLIKNPWLDVTLDAHRLPFYSNSISNIVLFDAIHHFFNPLMFMKEAYRVLKPGGRLILIEPFPTPFSLFIYRRFHPEPFIMDKDYFAVKNLEYKDAWEANQAIPYLLFFKNKGQLESLFNNSFKIVKRKKFGFLYYPLTGGFDNSQIFPDKVMVIVRFIEFLLIPFNWFLAFRCYVVIEKS
jgi:SAM-dependent methyltransferase